MRASTKAAKAISTSRTAISKNIPVETRLMAISTSHAEATYAPTRVHLVRNRQPHDHLNNTDDVHEGLSVEREYFQGERTDVPGPVG